MIPVTKSAIAQTLDSIGLFDRVSFGVRGRLIIFNYHRIRPNDPDFTAGFDPNVYGPTQDVFERQVEWLSRHRKILSEDDLLEAIQKRKLPDERCSMITFDDGYRDNYDLALPILKRYRVPASFFIPTGLIENRRLGWWDLISYIVNRSSEHSIRYKGEHFVLNGNRSSVIQGFIRKMTLQDAGATQDLVPALTDLCRVEPPSRDLQDKELMTWEQICEMARSGMTIGSHTHTHPVLKTLPAKAQQSELGISREILQSKTGQSIRSIAYPVGGRNHFTDCTKDLAKDCGYSVGYSFATGINHATRDSFNIRRVSGPQSLAFLAAKASFPVIFAQS
jgi:peptidoglycan/xylan/chitin deacetylase (PgdA/CDA1 family)